MKQHLNFKSLILLCLLACNNPPGGNRSTISESPKQDSSVSRQEPTIRIERDPVEMPQRDVVLSEATSISNDFYNNLKIQNYPGANKYMHPDALSVTPVNEWIKIYLNVQNKMGKLGFVKMVAHGAKCKIEGGNGFGDYAELIFDAQYKDGNLREKLIFFRKDSTESVKILGYENHQILERVKLSDVLK